MPENNRNTPLHRGNVDVQLTTPDESRWRASVNAPEKIKRKLRLLFRLLCGWCAGTTAWIIAMLFDRERFSWWSIPVIFAGYFNSAIGIINHRAS